MKKRIASVALIVLILALFAYGTTAFISAEGRATNVITTGTVSMLLTEKYDKTQAEAIVDGGGVMTGLKFENVMPSQTLSKEPVIENTGSQSFWLRVRLTASMTDPTGKPLDTGVIDYDGLDASLWTDGQDGWLYYNEAVKTGESVSVFKSVTFDASMGNEYQGARAEIAIAAQAVQTANNPIPDGGSILDVQGWPAQQ